MADAGNENQVTRRRLFAIIPGVTGAAALTHGAGRRPVIAGHPWVYAATQPKYDIYPILDRIFADMSWAGIEAIELMSSALEPGDAVERVRDLAAKYRLPVIGMSHGANMFDRSRQTAILEEAERLIGRLAQVGGRTLGTSVGDTGSRKKTPEELDAQADVVKKLMGICVKNKVVLNLHNHIYEVRDDEYDLKGTLARVPDVMLGPDLDWLKGAGVDPVDFIRRYGNRIVYAHLRDRKADGVWSEAMGEGVTDYAAIGRALRDVKFSGDVAIELAHPRGFQPTRPLRESLKMSREYVSKTMGW